MASVHKHSLIEHRVKIHFSKLIIISYAHVNGLRWNVMNSKILFSRMHILGLFAQIIHYTDKRIHAEVLEVFYLNIWRIKMQKQKKTSNEGGLFIISRDTSFRDASWRQPQESRASRKSVFFCG